MPPQNPEFLTDKQIADIAYLHTQLMGNSVSAVTESEVKNVRLDVKSCLPCRYRYREILLNQTNL